MWNTSRKLKEVILVMLTLLQNKTPDSYYTQGQEMTETRAWKSIVVFGHSEELTKWFWKSNVTCTGVQFNIDTLMTGIAVNTTVPRHTFLSDFKINLLIIKIVLEYHDIG